jgi:hypothetical protein
VKKQRTAEEACIEYHLATVERRRQHEIVCAPTCENIIEWDALLASGHYPEQSRPSTCLDELFGAPKGPDGEFPRHEEFFDECCDPCKEKLGALKLRAHAGMRIGAAKRSIGAIGKRLTECPKDIGENA